MLHFAQPYWFCWRGMKSVARWWEKLWNEETGVAEVEKSWELFKVLTSPWLHLQKQPPCWNKSLALILLKKTANHSLSINAPPSPILCLPQSLSVPHFLTLSFDFHSVRWTLSEYQGTVSALNRAIPHWKKLTSWKHVVIWRWKLKSFFRSTWS